MKKVALVAALAAALTTPALAETAKPTKDPFVSTQGSLGPVASGNVGLAAIGALAVVVAVAASDGT